MRVNIKGKEWCPKTRQDDVMKSSGPPTPENIPFGSFTPNQEIKLL